MATNRETSAGNGRSPCMCLALALTAVVLAVCVVAFIALDRDRGAFSPETTLDLLLRDGVHIALPQPEGGPDSVLRVAIAPVISPEASAWLYGDLIGYIAKNMGQRPSLVRGKNYSEVNDLIRMRQCDMAMVCTYSYVLAKAGYGVRLLAAPVVNGKRVYHSLIVVPASSDVSALSDLRNQRFASCDVLSTSGWLYPVTMLKQQGFDAARFFKKHIISGSHDRSVFAVKSGIVDAAAVESLVYERMVSLDSALDAQLKVIHRSPSFGMPPLVVPAGLPEEQFAKLQQVLLNMHTNAEGRRILAALGFDRFFVPDDDDYDSVRKLHNAWSNQP